MFPGGLDPNLVRVMQERAGMLEKTAERIWPVYDSVTQNLKKAGAFEHQEGHYAALQRALLKTPPSPAVSLPPGVMSSLQNSMGFLNSPGVLDRLKVAIQASEMTEQRFGPDGLAAAEQIAAHRLAAGPGLERGAERILNGRADEILDEAAAIASSPEARQTIEQADKDALLELAQLEAEQDSKTFGGEVLGGEVRAGLDVETVVASVGTLSEEELQVLEYYTIQLMRVLLSVVAAAVAGAWAVGAEQTTQDLLGKAMSALSGVYALQECAKAARAERSTNG